jgi:hypothetical protein
MHGAYYLAPELGQQLKGQPIHGTIAAGLAESILRTPGWTPP